MLKLEFDGDLADIFVSSAWRFAVLSWGTLTFSQLSAEPLLSPVHAQ